MEFRILGPVEVLDGATAVDLGRPKQRALLGLLLLRAGQAVSADRLVEELWNGRPPGQALASLQSYVSNLRRVLEPERRAGEPPEVLVRRPAGYVVQVDPSALDASRFEAGVARARRALAAGDHASAERTLDEALALWRGEPLAELAAEIEPVPEIPRLSELRLTALEERAEAALALGRHAELVADLDAFVREHPLRERARGQLALALYRVGRQAEALERLREGRQLLSDELGLAPSPALRELEQQILQHAPELQWRPLPERPREAPARSLTRPERPLVGRAEELAPLVAAWREALEGRGAVALISGDPGIGKTRLAEELATLAADDGALVCWGRAFEGGGAPPFWPWTQVVEAAIGHLDDDALHKALGARAPEIARLVPAISARLGAGEEPTGDPGEARFRLYDAVAGLLLQLAAARPLAIVLDDVHWTDAPSLELLLWVARRVRAASMLVVATYRDAEADRGEALGETLAGLVREAPLVRLKLEGLTIEDVSILLAQHLAARPPDDLARTLHAQTDGNAFYLTELVRLVQSRGVEQADALPSWDDIPSGVREVIERRVSRLPEETIRVLETAAVIGREFELELTAAGHDAAPERLLELLDPALGARIVERIDGSASRFRFAHALVRETVYGTLPNSRRVRLHGAVGAALEQLARGGRLSELAFHYERAAPLGLSDRAVEAALAAAGHAQTMLAFEQAEAHLRQALRLLEQTGDPNLRECRVQAQLASLLLMTRGFSAPGLAAAASRVRELAANDSSDPSLPRVLWALWSYHCVRAEFAESLVVADELVARGQTLDEPISRVAGLQARGTALYYTGKLHEAIACFESALDALSGAGPAPAPVDGLEPTQVAVHVHSHAGHAFALAGRFAEAEAQVREALRSADRDTAPFDYATAAMMRGWVGALHDDLSTAREWLHEAVLLCEDHGFRQFGALAGVVLGWVHAVEGDLAGGIATMEAGIETIKATGGKLRHWHLALLADALISAGRDDEALAALEEGLAAWRETGEAIQLPELLRLKGALMLRQGRDEADALLEQALVTATHQGAVVFQRRAQRALEAARTAA